MNKKHPIYGYVISTKENTQQLLDSGKKFEDFSKEDWEIYSDLSMDEEFIEKYQDKICWHKIGTKKHKISKKFIKNNIQRISWVHISIFQKLSEKFIEEFQDKVDWYFISMYQKLSEKFIEKFQDKVHWNKISFYQKFSESFIERNFEKLCWDSLIKNKKIKISKNFLLKIYKEHKYELFDVLKLMPGIKQYSKLIEKQIPKLLIEIEN